MNVFVKLLTGEDKKSIYAVSCPCCRGESRWQHWTKEVDQQPMYSM